MLYKCIADYLSYKLSRSVVGGEKDTEGKHRINLILVCYGQVTSLYLAFFA